MKFNSDLCAKTFLFEIKRFDKIDEAGKEYVPTDPEILEFLKQRSPLVKKLKDHRKSSAQKANWRKNRHTMLKGIKAFHKSVKGKRFHRQLGRFLATRIFRQKSKAANEAFFDMLLAKREYLKGLNSAKQHLLVEMNYFHQLNEQVELEELITDYAYPFLQSIEDAVIEDRELEEDQVVFLMDLVEGNALIDSFADKTGKSFEEIDDMWKNIAKDLKKDGIDKDDDRFFPFLVTRLKKKLGIK